MEKNNLKKIFTHLSENKIRFSTVESITGGQLAVLFTALPGASNFFQCGLICYSNLAKVNLLGIDEQALQEHGAISSWTALEMLKGTEKLLHSDLIISLTGNAGPKLAEEKPLGLTYLGIYYKAKFRELVFQANAKERQEIIDQTIDFVLQELVKILEI